MKKIVKALIIGTNVPPCQWKF